MRQRYNLNRLLHGDLAEAKVRKNPNTCCDPSGQKPSTLKQWRDQAKTNTGEFLEKQFGKPVQKFERGDWRAVKLNCSRFLPKSKVDLINNRGAGRISKEFIQSLFKTKSVDTSYLSSAESIKLIKRVFRKAPEELTFKQKTMLVKDVEMMSQLNPKFMLKYNLFPDYTKHNESRVKQPDEIKAGNMLSFIKRLGHDASPDTVDKTLMNMPVRSKLGKPSRDPETGKVILPDTVWRWLAYKRNELPDCVRLRYAAELRLIKKKPGRKPKIKKPLTPEELEAELANQERKARKNQTATPKTELKPKKPKPQTIKVTKPKSSKISEEYEDILDDDLNDEELENLIRGKQPRSKPVEQLDGYLADESQIVKFINQQANKALIPGELPRPSTFPKSGWDAADWSMVHVFKDRINPDWYAKHRDYVETGLRKIGKSINASLSNLARDNKQMAIVQIQFYRLYSLGDKYA